MEVQRLFRKLSAFSLELKNRVRPLLTLVALQCAASPALGVKRASPPALGQLSLAAWSPADLPVLVQVFPGELCHWH